MEKKYWKSLEELQNEPENSIVSHDVVPEKSMIEMLAEETTQKPASRRNFLKFCGFGFATAAIASSCENPLKKAIPYLNKPEEVTPGLANHYASFYFDGSDYCSIVAKVRDGRPIKIEGNELSSFSKGGTTARVQASVLGLYDDGGRFKTPMIDGKEVNWFDMDKQVTDALSQITSAKGNIVILSSSIISPSTRQLIEEFSDKFGTRLVTYDPVSVSAILLANKESFGVQVLPEYRFDKAEVILSIGADFLGTWLTPVEYARQFAETRRPTEKDPTMSELIVVETGLSITGSNADLRIPLKPSVIYGWLVQLHAALNGNPPAAIHEAIGNISSKLLAAQGKSLVVCGINDINCQLVVNSINQLLQSYGNTIDLSNPLLTRQAIDQDMVKLVDDMNNGLVSGLLIYQINPVYDYFDSNRFISGLGKVKMTLSFASSTDETAKLVKFICPDSNYLESWNDAQPKKNIFSLGQPTINRIYSTRQFQESLLKWMGIEPDFYTFIRKYWEKNIFPKQSEYSTFDNFWNNALQSGVFEPTIKVENQPTYKASLLSEAISSLTAYKVGDGIELSFYETIALGNGKQANNPWLQELPDPIAKVCWDNFAAISPKLAAEQKINTGDVIRIGESLMLPALLQPGQAYGSISIALGYGRKDTGKVADGIGQNIYPFAKLINGTVHHEADGLKISKTGEIYKLALTQTHHSMEGRAIVRETTLGEYKENPAAGNELHEKFEEEHVTLYKEFPFNGHHWAMAIDLNACTGCSACVIACQTENNVPVIGKEEVMKTRIMHWIRIDRYYSDEIENPSVYHQPVMCQHCDNAPCENVCPVSATNHSSEGLNQMAYNRCIGTKYCINNCPYKVRRFNWFRYATNKKFDYNMNSDLGRMVLNPDVTVRERGVVEKCSFCVQRIQEKKLLAKLENRPLRDNEILPACGQACPSNAIVFGDLNDPESRIAKMFKNKRNYHLLEEIHTLPSVGYLTKVRNNEKV
jgi:MoCo/4Fe-4S cofactor protein with predicted Tat translocation signal